jgi:transcriptional regulator with XRE-family HTH domain
LALHHSTLTRTVSPPVDPLAGLKADFAARLRAAIARKGWTATVVVHHVSRSLGNGNKFGRSHLCHYMHGRALPRPRYLMALSRALGVEPRELLPDRPDLTDTSTSRSACVDMVQVRDDSQGTALLEMSHRMPWQTAVKVMRILKSGETSRPQGRPEGFAVSANHENGARSSR